MGIIPYAVTNPLTATKKVKIPPSEDPYRKARDFINMNKKLNCCNIIKRDNSVQKWQLPQDKPKVHIKKVADSGTTLYYHDDLRGSNDFPH